jgi:hypothetical protein
VGLHDLPLLVRELAGLVDDLGGDPDFSDVVEERGQLGVLLRARVQAHLRRDADHELDDVYVDPFRNR